MGDLTGRPEAIEGEEPVVFAGDDWMHGADPQVGVVLHVTRDGPPCACGSTTYTYQRDAKYDVIARCAECLAQTGFRLSEQLNAERCVAAHTRLKAEDSAEGWV